MLKQLISKQSEMSMKVLNNPSICFLITKNGHILIHISHDIVKMIVAFLSFI